MTAILIVVVMWLYSCGRSLLEPLCMNSLIYFSQLPCKVGPSHLLTSLCLHLSSPEPRGVRDHGLLGMLSSCIFLLGPWGTISIPLYTDFWGGMICKANRNRETQRHRTHHTAKATNSRDGPGFSLYPFFLILKKCSFLFIWPH